MMAFISFITGIVSNPITSQTQNNLETTFSFEFKNFYLNLFLFRLSDKCLKSFAAITAKNHLGKKRETFLFRTLQ